jgi:hypothetical protein
VIGKDLPQRRILFTDHGSLITLGTHKNTKARKASVLRMRPHMADFLPVTINASAGKLIVSLAKYFRAASATVCFTVGN